MVGNVRWASRAIRFAHAMTGSPQLNGVAVSAGVQSGEVVVGDGSVSGRPVEVAMRLAEAAAPGQILATATVRDSVAGSGIRFENADVSWPDGPTALLCGSRERSPIGLNSRRRRSSVIGRAGGNAGWPAWSQRLPVRAAHAMHVLGRAENRTRSGDRAAGERDPDTRVRIGTPGANSMTVFKRLNRRLFRV